MFFYPFFPRANTQAITMAAEKLKQRNLPMQDILNEDDLMNDLKYSNNSQLVNHITKEDMIELLKYVVNEPHVDDYKTGYKFPFNAAEILSGENTYLLDKFFEDSNVEEDKYEELDEYEGQKVDKAEKVHLKEENTNGLSEKVGQLELNAGETGSENDINFSDVKIEENTLNDKKDNEEESKEKNLKNKEDLTETEKKDTSIAKEQNIPKYEVFDYYLSFLDQNKDLNYVLVGYFSKIFTSLKYNRPAAIVRYFFLYKKEYLFKMVQHLNRKGISDSLLKILLIDANELVAEVSLEYENKLKYEIVEKIIQSFDVHNDERCQNICDLFTEAINNKKFAFMIFKNESILRKINSLIFDHIDSEYFKELLKLGIKLGEIFLAELRRVCKEKVGNSQDIPTFDVTDNGDKRFSNGFDDNKPAESLDLKYYPHFIEIFTSGILPLVKDYVSNENSNSPVKLPTTFNKTLQILGTRKLIEFEHLYQLIEISSLYLNYNFTENKIVDEDKINNFCDNEIKMFNHFISILIENDFFKASIDNFFTYEWNNSYHKLFDLMIEGIINSHQSENIYYHLFAQLHFLNKIIDHGLKMKFTYNSGNEINPGYLPYLLEISHKINSNSNKYIQEEISKSARWEKFFQQFVEPIRKRFAIGLKYDVNEGNNFFCEEVSKMDKEQEFVETEKNYIDFIRKQANSTLTLIPTMNLETDSSMKTEMTNNIDTISQETEPFTDNNYWHITVSLKESEINEILKDLDMD